MKKKAIVLVLTLSMTLTFAGCGKGKEETLAPEVKNVAEEVKEEIEETEEELETEKPEKKESKKASGAVLGGDEEDFDGFKYLYPEELKTKSEENSDTGKKESQSVKVLVIDSDYVSVNRDYAYSDELGVKLKVTLNPYFQYKQEDYLLTENVQAWLENEYDEYYSTEYKDLVIGDIEELDKNRIVVKVSYIKYDKWDDMNIPVYKYILVNELSSKITVMAEVEIDLAATTGKTPELLKEIEAFYDFKIDWTKEAAEARVAEFVSKDTGDTEAFSTGYMLFELPKGWAADYDYDYTVDAYAPNGDAENAECVLVLSREFTSEGYDVTMLLVNPEYTKNMFQEMVGATASNIEVIDMEETSLGHTVKITLDVEDEDYLTHYSFYFAASDNYLYTIYAAQTDDAVDDALTIADDVVLNAKLKN